MLNSLKSPRNFAHYTDSVLVDPNDDDTGNPQRTTDGARLSRTHIKVNVRSLLHSTHSTTVEETKYTYRIIRRHINDALSR